MKVIFLDIDGVLWVGHQGGPDATGERNIYAFGAAQVTELNRIMAIVDDCKIVISSSWRIGRSLEWLREHFAREGFMYPERIIDKTPYLRSETSWDVKRGFEIQRWLDNNPGVITFCIIDDDSDMLHLLPRLVKTTFPEGLNYVAGQKVIEMLRTFDGAQAVS